MRLLSLFVFLLLVFVLQKPLFMGWYWGTFSDEGWRGLLRVMWHGLPLDASMSGYLCAVPALLLLLAIWLSGKWTAIIRTAMRVWIGISAAAVALTFLLNAVLYDYWTFPLDSTPFFYFLSSPKDAFASAGIAEIIVSLLLFCVLTVALYEGGWRMVEGGRLKEDKRWRKVEGGRLKETGALLLILAVMAVVMRGGITVSSMNTGRVYFSNNQSMNHAAVNPLFSLMESLAHQSDFGKQYRLLDDATATKLFTEMTKTDLSPTDLLLSNTRPDIYIIILESFSSKLMKTLGGNGTAQSLDSIAAGGVLFTHFYANSFRTDRGLVSILCGYPAQPTMSMMKYPRKTASLPSIPRTLLHQGYDLAYYYGGDADFTNMRSFLVSQGFERIIADKDFQVKDRLSKWGVPDHLVYERLRHDIEQDWKKHNPSNADGKPLLRVLQTSSSHEPFDVPYQALDDERLNAFAYADHCVGEFINWLQSTEQWQRSLVILLPDHLGCYPQGISNFDFSRYEIPLIFTGGAVKVPKIIETVGSQHDLAATLLAQMGIDHSEFIFSKDLLDATAPHFAFFTVPDAFGIVNKDGRVIYDNKSEKAVAGDKHDERLLQLGKAYLQKLYDDIQER